MPIPTDLRLFARTEEIDSPKGCKLMTKKERDKFIKYHYSPASELKNDKLHAQYFSMFALRIYVWGITRYAEGTHNFDIIGVKKQTTSRKSKGETPTSRMIRSQFFKNKNSIQSKLPPNTAEQIIRNELSCGSNLANSLDYYARVNNINDEYYLNMIDPLANAYGSNEENHYTTAIMDATASLSCYQPLTRLGAGYMQLKRAGEINKEIEDDWQVTQLMGALQQAAFDIVSYNIGASLYYAQAKYLSIENIPTQISEIFSPEIDLRFELSKQDALEALSKIEQKFGKDCLGEFLKNLKKEMNLASIDDFNQIVHTALMNYQTEVAYKPIIEIDGHHKQYAQITSTYKTPTVTSYPA
ncbi:hypothetical protein Lsai_3473 [Legionella sainthelensi]|uniref:Uncharacterized protein n=1 Tax=Legionella sainthelensi TaxID=28087 RepID=A0A0W0YCT5_9GAMM|nr:hypothetical protein [Legionella sainthelensi]KTD54651.1 hypothetical protein Lsai_3473 [Legionella sainthelensi]VEH33715.1 Uncharacterised protein [Legionella sainthelensi]